MSENKGNISLIVVKVRTMKQAAAILSYNHPNLTERCVVSVLNHFNGDNIFLIHNGSTSENVHRLTSKFPQLNHVVSKDNSGFSGGANRGLMEAFKQADGVYFFSNDTELLSIPEAADLDLAAACVFRRSTSHIESYGGKINLSQGKLEHIQSLDDEKLDYVPGSAFYISKKAWSQTRGFDPSFHAYWEDVDLSLRAKGLGLKLGALKEFKVKHGISKTCGGDPKYTVYFYQRNRLKVAIKHGSVKSRFLFSIYFSNDVLKRSVKYLTRGDNNRLRHLLKGVYHGLTPLFKSTR